MKRRLMISFPVAAALRSAVLAGNALAQSATKQQLAGTWKYVLASDKAIGRAGAQGVVELAVKGH